MVRDGYGSWIPCRHFLLELQKAVLIKASFKILRSWCPKWQPTASITDDSSSERLAIKAVFEDLGMQQYLCQKHVVEVFRSHFPKKYYPLVQSCLEKALWTVRT